MAVENRLNPLSFSPTFPNIDDLSSLNDDYEMFVTLPLGTNIQPVTQLRAGLTRRLWTGSKSHFQLTPPGITYGTATGAWTPESFTSVMTQYDSNNSKAYELFQAVIYQATHPEAQTSKDYKEAVTKSKTLFWNYINAKKGILRWAHYQTQNLGKNPSDLANRLQKIDASLKAQNTQLIHLFSETLKHAQLAKLFIPEETIVALDEDANEEPIISASNFDAGFAVIRTPSGIQATVKTLSELKNNKSNNTVVLTNETDAKTTIANQAKFCIADFIRSIFSFNERLTTMNQQMDKLVLSPSLTSLLQLKSFQKLSKFSDNLKNKLAEIYDLTIHLPQWRERNFIIDLQPDQLPMSFDDMTNIISTTHSLFIQKEEETEPTLGIQYLTRLLLATGEIDLELQETVSQMMEDESAEVLADTTEGAILWRIHSYQLLTSQLTLPFKEILGTLNSYLIPYRPDNKKTESEPRQTIQQFTDLKRQLETAKKQVTEILEFIQVATLIGNKIRPPQN